jgi:hypothetical protein
VEGSELIAVTAPRARPVARAGDVVGVRFDLSACRVLAR